MNEEEEKVNSKEVVRTEKQLKLSSAHFLSRARVDEKHRHSDNRTGEVCEVTPSVHGKQYQGSVVTHYKIRIMTNYVNPSEEKYRTRTKFMKVNIFV
jgi:hypothetical protein